MLLEVSKEVYRNKFTTDPNLFISEKFIGLVEKNCDRLVHLMQEDESSLGLILGIKDGIAASPFSAPFGGFHYTHEHLFYHIIDQFIADLKNYGVNEGLKKISITLPPDLYQVNMNAKLVNAFIRQGFTMRTPDFTNWASLINFDGTWAKSVVAQNCRKAVKHGLTWAQVTDMNSLQEAYAVIYRNREEMGRKIYMTLDDLLEVSTIFPVDFFLVRDNEGVGIAAAVFYRGNDTIATGIFLGDTMEKRNLGTMNFLYKNLFEHYKALGYAYIDLGTSSLEGDPNVGLIRFKELHNCITSLRFSFSWMPS